MSLMPHLARQQEPARLQIDRPWTATAEDFSSAGLYNQKEIQEWQGKMLFPSYRRATLGAVAYSSCLAAGECAAEGTANIPNKGESWLSKVQTMATGVGQCSRLDLYPHLLQQNRCGRVYNRHCSCQGVTSGSCSCGQEPLRYPLPTL